MPHHLRTSLSFIDSKIRQTLPLLYRWYRRHQRPLPWRRNPTPYRVTVSEFMAQQTRMSTVIPYYLRWIRRFPHWSSLAKAPRQVVLRHWEGLGYYRRARFLHKLARVVVRRPGRRLPSDPKTLRTLPGIGDYTAGAIASIAFGIAEPSFDGNVARVLGRLLARRGRVRNGKVLRQLAGRIVPHKDPGTHNQALMELGALICKPENPLCGNCPFCKICPSAGQKVPRNPSQPKISQLQESVWVVQKGTSVWLTRQHPFNRWQGLWLLPTFSPTAPSRKSLGHISYPYTRYRISAEVQKHLHPPKGFAGRWFSKGELSRVPLPIPHRRILTHWGDG